ncbi:MAG: hypothetical protein R3F61_26820 [Myxococcota bacterium]
MSASLAVHLVVGTLALVAYWAALASRKGSARHRWLGRTFFVAMLAVVASVAPLLLGSTPVDPGHVVQLVYLSVCVATVVTLGWTAVRWRREPERFHGAHLRPLGGLLSGLGALVLFAGLGTGDPVPVVLSWVGLAYGSAMWRSSRGTGAWPRGWWLCWHLDAIAGLFTAVHGTVAYVTWRELVMPGAGPWWAALAHAGVLVLAVGFRAWAAGHYRAPSVVFVVPGRVVRPSPA